MADATMENDKQKFVTIDLSKKQIDMAHPTVNGKNGKTYVRVFAPGGGVFFYPAESIKTKKNDENRVYFTRPEGTEFTVHFSSRIEGVPDNAPNDQKYNNYTKTIRIEDLKEMYEEERRAFAEKFVGTMISEKLIHPFVSPKSHKNFYEVSVPVYENGSEKATFYKIVVPEQRIKDGDRDGQKYLSLFINNQDGEETVYAAKHNYQDNNGDWQTTVRNMTSRDVIAAFKNSAERYRADHASNDNSIQDELNAGQNCSHEASEPEIHRARHGR